MYIYDFKINQHQIFNINLYVIVIIIQKGMIYIYYIRFDWSNMILMTFDSIVIVILATFGKIYSF